MTMRVEELSEPTRNVSRKTDMKIGHSFLSFVAFMASIL